MTEQIARALITRHDRILLCRNKGRDYSFFPGGHIEAGETPVVALVREMEEEAGLQLMNIQFVAEVPHGYEVGEERYEEVNYLFQADIGADEVTSREDHLDFFWIPRTEFGETRVLPMSIKSMVVDLLREGRR